MYRRHSVAVLGGGSFGTVIANMLAENGHSVRLWMRDPERAAEVRDTRINQDYLPDYRLHDDLLITSDMSTALNAADTVFMAIPSKSFRAVLQQARPFIGSQAMIVSTAKGIETATFMLMSQVIAEECPSNPAGVISGPNLAGEIVKRQLTGTVIASKSPDLCQKVHDMLRSHYFRVYSNSDVYGVELGGVLKNIYAIMAGMAASLGLGNNTLSMLMTRGLAEMGRFAGKLGANPMTFIGLAGVGDLIVTCISPLSRNYQVGHAIGKGCSLEQAVEEVGFVAEGVNTLRLVKEKADELGVYMPLASGLYEILFNHQSIADVVGKLMGAEQNSDVDYFSASAIGDGSC